MIELMYRANNKLAQMLSSIKFWCSKQTSIRLCANFIVRFMETCVIPFSTYDFASRDEMRKTAFPGDLIGLFYWLIN